MVHGLLAADKAWRGKPGKALYEAKDVAADHPRVVRELQAKLAEGPNIRPIGKAKGPLRFWIPRHPESGFPPQSPVKKVPGPPIL